MKNTLIIGGVILLVLLLASMFWYDSDYRMGMSLHMDMMQGQTESDLAKLPDYAVETVKPTEVVELADGDTYELEATIVKQEVGNRSVKRLAYNGQIPGPVLKVQKGARVTINFTNNIDMETALHSHGLRGDYLMDGAMPITPPIEVGESFSYELEFPDTGVYWYHPHVREDYQQELGLYGNFIVEETGYWNDVEQEEYLIFDDILEAGDFNSKVVTNTLMGRFGDTLLINDKDNFNLFVTQGEISRIFVTNVANTRTFDITFDGAGMKLVGGDNGRIEQEVLIDDFIIAPSERYIVELLYPEAGTYPIMHRGEKVGEVTVAESETDRSKAFNTLRSNVSDYTEFRSQMDGLLAKTPDKRLRLDIEMKGMMGGMMMNEMQNENSNETVNLMGMEMSREGAVEHCQMMPQMTGCEPYLDTEAEEDGEHSAAGIEWEDDMAMMNQMSTDKNIEWIIEDQATGKQNGDIDWSFKQDDMVKVRIYNDENGMHPMQHPIHFHGQRFVVLATDGVANDNLQWKDTVLIPKGQTVDLLVDMSNVGTWMAHCHIAEHLHSGMMFQFEVE